VVAAAAARQQLNRAGVNFAAPARVQAHRPPRHLRLRPQARHGSASPTGELRACGDGAGTIHAPVHRWLRHAAFISTLPLSMSGGSKFQILLFLIPAFVISGLLLYIVFRKNKKVNTVVKKLWVSFRDGMLSIFKLERKGLFAFYSLFIWLLYFAMSYTVLKAFPATSELGFNAVLSLFAIGAIAMAAPLPGGMGSYHVLVPQGLFFLYDIPLPEAVAFTFIFHGWQTALYIVFGALSLIITSVLVKKNAAQEKQARELSS
jgi:hypothetical protein